MLASKGDRSALVAAHSKWLSAFLRGLTRSEADAEDAFQEVWMRVFSADLPAKMKSERAYLARVARSVVIDRHRKSERMVVSADEPDDEGETLAERLVDTSPTPRENVEWSSLHADVLAAVRALRPGPREVALLRVEGELTFQEISDIMGIPLGTALGWMRTATECLKKSLKEYYGRRS